jgi:hypothetical protein
VLAVTRGPLGSLSEETMASQVRGKRVVREPLKVPGFKAVSTLGIEGRSSRCKTLIYKRRWSLPPVAERA